MIGTLLIGCALLGLDNCAGGSSVGAPADRTVYESARKTAGHDAGAHVRLALWCESNGLPAERMKHLALAVLYNPSHVLARGLLGLVEYQGKWGSPEDVGKRIQDDPAYRDLIREYLERRVQATHKADSQMRLAAWCEEKGLRQQAIAHYNEVVQLDPSKDVAWRRLGYKKVGDRWVKVEEAVAAKREAELQKSADKRWKARLEKLREGLEAKDPARRDRTERALSEVTDPRAVPMIWAVFVYGSERLQLAAVQMLGQIDGPSASTALATLAILYPEGRVSRRASETLTRRDPRDIVGRLITMIRKPFTYQVRPVDGAGSTGELFVEGEKFNVRRLYRSTPIDPSWIPASFFSPSPGFASAGSSQGVLIARRLEAIRQENQSLQQRLNADIQAIEQINAQCKQLNARVLPIVTNLTGQNLGAEPEKWKAWWTDQLGYAFQAQSSTAKPTFTEVVDSPSWSASLECFGAGTLVRTIDGPRPIESIRVGDRLLSQKTSTGALAFQPVLAVHHTKSAPTLRVALDSETIVATGIHRFWKSGEGWTMARDLKPGDRIRVVGDVAKVRSVDANPAQPVYNLDVAENHDFFVGTRGLLVHDSDFVQPVPEPFDRLVIGH